jgi:hypothetical protein
MPPITAPAIRPAEGPDELCSVGVSEYVGVDFVGGPTEIEDTLARRVDTYGVTELGMV